MFEPLTLATGTQVISQTKLAEALGLSRKAVDSLRRAHSVPSALLQRSMQRDGRWFTTWVRVYPFAGALQLMALARGSKAHRAAQTRRLSSADIEALRRTLAEQMESVYEPLIVRLCDRLGESSEALRELVQLSREQVRTKRSARRGWADWAARNCVLLAKTGGEAATRGLHSLSRQG